jgi:RNA polymerase sigma-70 factor (ECF subfamily)
MGLQLVRPEETDARRVSADVVDVLYEAYAADVLRWARRLAGPTADIQDLVHDVFVVALQRIHTFHGDAREKTWLFRTTHHVVRNHKRRGFVRELLFHRRKDEMAAALLSPATPMQEMERREEHERLYRALDRLPDRYRTLIILYDIEGLASDEIAELTGVNLGTVWVRLQRGRAKLFKILSSEAQP